jgi:C_GCAxxG_C_C family probable redox protein
VDDTAFRMFKLKNAGYCCTQVLIKMALDDEEKENEDLLRAANGLCMGVGSTQKTCGVLTGGIAILGLYAGKGNDKEYPKMEYSDMVDEYTEWFLEEFGSTECSDIIGVCTVKDFATNQGYVLKCGDLMIKSYEKIQEILSDHNFEFGSRE